MAKAMLIMDMPSSCKKCLLRDYHKSKFCFQCRAIPLSEIEEEEVNVRQEWCPLREVPQKKDICGRYNAEYFKQGGKPASFKVGYNACIDEILGGGE